MTDTAAYIEEFKKLIPTREPMSRDDIVRLGMEHELCEFNNDLDGVMDTLVEVPVYELHPAGIRITGRDAVREFYSKTLHIFQQFDERKVAAKDKTRGVVSVAFGDSHVVAEVVGGFTFPNGVRKLLQFLAVVEYRDGKMYGERVYSDKEFGDVVMDALGPDFLTRPGVTQIEKTI